MQEFIREFILLHLQNKIMVPKKFLYVGAFFEGSTVNHRYNDFLDIFTYISFFNTNNYFPLFKRSYASLWRKFGFGPPFNKLVKDLLLKIEIFQPNIIFFDKSLYFPCELLTVLKKSGVYLIHFSNDDQLNPKNQTKNYIKSIPVYDLHITTKSYNVDELYSLKAKKVEFVNNSTSKSFLYPIKVTNDDKIKFGSQVGFIGTYEAQRAESLLFLANNGIKIRIWGSGWKNSKITKHPSLIIEDGPLWGENYLKVICTTDININFLRKENRDLQTTRSIEIPACKGFMISEYSMEHEKLFRDNEEAVYFKNNLELLNKINYYINNKNKISEIASNGYNRCINSNYYYSEIFYNLFKKYNLC